MCFSAVLSCLLAAGVHAGTAAAGPAELTWPDCARAALAGNPDLKAARFRLDAAQSRRNAAFGGFLPQVDASATARSSGNGTPPVLAGIEPNQSASLTVSQPLFSGFSTFSDFMRSLASVRHERANLRAESAGLRDRLRSAFVGNMYAQDNIVLLDQIAARRKDNADLVRLRYEAGREDKGSALRVAADAAEAAFEAARARRGLSLARRRLARETGLSGGLVSVPVKGEWEPAKPPASPDYERLCPLVAPVEAAAAALEEARWYFRGAVSPFLPSAAATGSVTRNGPGWNETGGSWTAGASLSWNLFNGGRDSGAAAAARAEEGAAGESLEAARRDALVALEDAWNSWIDSYEAVTVRKQYLDAARTRAEIGRAQYTNGLLSFTQWDIIESDLVDAEHGYLDARRDALLAESAWLKTIGEELGDHP